MSAHRHVDPCDPDESYALPELRCWRCLGACCSDCSTTIAGHVHCDHCTSEERWLQRIEDERPVSDEP